MAITLQLLRDCKTLSDLITLAKANGCPEFTAEKVEWQEWLAQFGLTYEEVRSIVLQVIRNEK